MYEEIDTNWQLVQFLNRIKVKNVCSTIVSNREFTFQIISPLWTFSVPLLWIPSKNAWAIVVFNWDLDIQVLPARVVCFVRCTNCLWCVLYLLQWDLWYEHSAHRDLWFTNSSPSAHYERSVYLSVLNYCVLTFMVLRASGFYSPQGECMMSYFPWHTGWMWDDLLPFKHRVDVRRLTSLHTQSGCATSYFPWHTGWMWDVLLSFTHRVDVWCLTSFP